MCYNLPRTGAHCNKGSELFKGGALFRKARNKVILGNFVSIKLLSGSFSNFQGTLVDIRTIKINFCVTKCSVEMEIYEHVRPHFFPEITKPRIFLFLV